MLTVRRHNSQSVRAVPTRRDLLKIERRADAEASGGGVDGEVVERVPVCDVVLGAAVFVVVRSLNTAHQSSL